MWRSGERPRQVLRLANALVPQSTRRRPSPTTTRTPARLPTHQVTLTPCTRSAAPPTNRIHNAGEEQTVAVVHRRAARAIHNQNATTPHPSAIPRATATTHCCYNQLARRPASQADHEATRPTDCAETQSQRSNAATATPARRRYTQAGTKKAPRPPARPSARIPNPNARTRPQRLPSTPRWTVPPSTPRRTSRASSCQC